MRMRQQNVTIRRSKTHRKGSKQLKYEAQREKKNAHTIVRRRSMLLSPE